MSDTPHDNDVTTTARRIARQANAYGGNMRGGVLAFDADGRGGEWYAQGSWPSAVIVYPLTHGISRPGSSERGLPLPAAAGGARTLTRGGAATSDRATSVTDDREGVTALGRRDDRVGGRGTGRRHRQRGPCRV
jgi:hypothetical protein